MSESSLIAKAKNFIANTNIFSDMTLFENTFRMAKCLSNSDLIPASFRGKPENTMIAIELSNRLGMSPFAVMQSLYIVHGKPSFDGKFIIAMINSCGRFETLEFTFDGEGDEYGCTASAIVKSTGERAYGTKVARHMVKSEGWDQNSKSKSGAIIKSKWNTMPDLMYRYRAAAFFGRIYAADIMLGMYTNDELDDIEASNNNPGNVTVSKSDNKSAVKKKKYKSRMSEIKDMAKTLTSKNKEDVEIVEAEVVEVVDKETGEVTENPVQEPENTNAEKCQELLLAIGEWQTKWVDKGKLDEFKKIASEYIDMSNVSGAKAEDLQKLLDKLNEVEI